MSGLSESRYGFAGDEVGVPGGGSGCVTPAVGALGRVPQAPVS
jgi:hypothetical protein